ncbi:MAG: hypothetical protein H6752_08895 [Candidatus Omnitrophica bacterium]|nr:hypothetical protein [Candidatus Omnitrophota bacterium]
MSHLFLNSVERPARYVAGEFNQKPIDTEARVKWCFAFPDVYEIGMSFTGMSILYGLINQSPLSSCERIFTPWIDAEKRLAELGETLCSLENNRPLTDFDVLGFSLQHEMNYTNVLTILNSGGLPIHQRNRDQRYPHRHWRRVVCLQRRTDGGVFRRVCHRRWRGGHPRNQRPACGNAGP